MKKSVLDVCVLSIIQVLEVLGQESCVCVGVKKSVLDDSVCVSFIIQVLEVLGQESCGCGCEKDCTW